MCITQNKIILSTISSTSTLSISSYVYHRPYFTHELNLSSGFSRDCLEQLNCQLLCKKKQKNKDVFKTVICHPVLYVLVAEKLFHFPSWDFTLPFFFLCWLFLPLAIAFIVLLHHPLIAQPLSAFSHPLIPVLFSMSDSCLFRL